MIWQKASPVGIDIPVQRFQNWLYPQLKTIWGIDNDTDYDCHGRAYKNQTADGYIPEVFIGTDEDPTKLDYKEVFLDDCKSALSFFATGDVTRYSEGDTTIPIALVFLVNVDALKDQLAYRGDEEIRNDVERLCQIDRFGFQLMEIITGIDQVFKEYSGWRKKEGMKFRDMHPYHCFRLNFSTLYDINACYSPLPNNF
jgi:hypothetical protein